MVEQLDSKILLLEQINNEVMLKEAETNRILNEKIQELRELLERKETMFQAKEKKWAEVERILVTYARKDLDLRQKLTDIKYICDDPSSKRRITTIVNENENLQKQLLEKQDEIETIQAQYSMQTQVPGYEIGDDFLCDGASKRISTVHSLSKPRKSKPLVQKHFEPEQRQKRR